MSLANAPNDKFFSIVSPTINFKNTGTTTLWTVPVSVSFLALSYSIICDTATAVNRDVVFNIGWTAASYNDFLNAAGVVIDTAATYENVPTTGGGPNPVFPANTAIILNITSGETGTALTGRFIFSGIYI